MKCNSNEPVERNGENSWFIQFLAGLGLKENSIISTFFGKSMRIPKRENYDTSLNLSKVNYKRSNIIEIFFPI